MARTSQTQLAVLGALSIEPMTGYRLRAEIVQTLGHFWQESFGQVYPALAALEEEGLLEREPDGDQPTGRSGNVFHLTAAGRERLRELLAQPFSQPPPRDPLLLRLFFGHHVEPALVRTWLTEALTGAERACEHYDELRAEIEREPDFATRGVFRLLTVSAGRHAARARADWAREALELLEGVVTDGRSGAGGRRADRHR
ncbi:PadR family transcriptional regulator [Kineococcus auxinigenes]|uniref:PadR family transcriptional regulator n=1 Tax=unclassified Kineococcus TaxID=2621656 RepID=UPI003D7D39A9